MPWLIEKKKVKSGAKSRGKTCHIQLHTGVFAATFRYRL